MSIHSFVNVSHNIFHLMFCCYYYLFGFICALPQLSGQFCCCCWVLFCTLFLLDIIKIYISLYGGVVFRSIFCRYTNQFSVLHFCTMCKYSVRLFFFSRYPDAFFFSLSRSFSCSLALYSVLHRCAFGPFRSISSLECRWSAVCLRVILCAIISNN